VIFDEDNGGSENQGTNGEIDLAPMPSPSLQDIKHAGQLIMALWDAVNSPIRIMDEYDVFMDRMNQMLCAQLLKSVATGKKNVQFVFLTPRDMPGMSTSDIITIHRMADPRK